MKSPSIISRILRSKFHTLMQSFRQQKSDQYQLLNLLCDGVSYFHVYMASGVWLKSNDPFHIWILGFVMLIKIWDQVIKELVGYIKRGCSPGGSVHFACFWHINHVDTTRHVTLGLCMIVLSESFYEAVRNVPYIISYNYIILYIKY